MRILLTGGTGQVGWELARTLMPLGEVIAVDRSQADLSDLNTLKGIVEQHQPHVIVNPAAYTAVDKAESESELAFLVNAEAPRVLAEEANKIGALLVHYSTDYVFDGSKNTPYTENDATHPINVYGQSKLAGEQAIQSAGGDYLILRTSWVYASRGSNFLRTIMRLAAEREELKIVADQIGTPTWARLIAEVTVHVVRQSVFEQQSGIFNSNAYHLTASGETSWHGFAQKIVDIVREQGKAELKNQVIHPIPTTDYPLPAKRPANSRLSNERLEQQFGLVMPSWDNALRLCMQELS
ncbi:dTDP-4-dehydrorhamnose reductase RfbD [Methyloglobulus morosus KoM1]|uniref:dTDP-4-dehydrorhamnose reductase n=1 Tax=Methyloglobulus morosus KoM1 TaxID=1116472 RepID=V5C4A9_9GAMM|nr:dTDP-4-dehydrorhamnose reductase [Methyloglobulus morosus]ESS71588.1 dTDP-4-dehydrorhamnose reductase RfbD [Methyloglobulus morosus KoM1]